MAGVDTEFEGEAWPAKGYSVGYLPQEPELDEDATVRENVMAGLGETADLVGRFNELTAKLAEPMDDDEMQKVYDEMAQVQDAIDAADAWDLDRTIEIAMDALRVPDGDAEVTHLSGGERRRVALCKLLLSKPDILLLDEPTNHLDAETVAWLQQHLQQYKGMVVAITHDRYFLDEVAEWILELDRGKGFPYEGNYSGWLDQKRSRLRPGGAGGVGPAAPARRGGRVGQGLAAGSAQEGQGARRVLRDACSTRTARSRSPSRSS